MGIKIKHTDPTLNEFATDDLVVNVQSGSLFFKSNTTLFKLQGDNLSTAVTESGLSNLHQDALGNISASGNLEVTGGLSISGITNVSSSIAAAVAGGDNLGNHTATQDLDLGGNDIKNIQHITASGNISASSGLFKGTVTIHQPSDVGSPSLIVDRTNGDPSIKSEGNDYVIIDSSGQKTLINHYVSDDVGLASGGGDVIIGENINPLAKLHISGNIWASGSSGHVTASGNISASGNLSATGDLDIDGVADITSTLTVGGSVLIQSANFIQLEVDQTDSGKASFGVTSGTSEAFIISTTNNASFDADIKFLTNDGSTTSEIVRFKEDGKVGIGISSPEQQLHVKDNIFLGDNAGGGNFIHGRDNLALSADGVVSIVADANDTSGTGTSDLFLGYGSPVDLNTVATSSYADTFPSNKPRVTLIKLDSSGNNVGIGPNFTGAADMRLHVSSSNANILKLERSDANNVNVAYTNTTGTMYAGIDTVSSALIWGVGTNQDMSAGSVLTVSGSGVGIGTNSPLYNLHIQSENDAAIYLEADTDNVGSEDHNAFIRLTHDGSGNGEWYLGTTGAADKDPEHNASTSILNNSLFIGSTSAHPVQLVTNNIGRLNVSSDGRIGIGTTTPSHTLTIDISSDVDHSYNQTTNSNGLFLKGNGEARAAHTGPNGPGIYLSSGTTSTTDFVPALVAVASKNSTGAGLHILAIPPDDHANNPGLVIRMDDSQATSVANRFAENSDIVQFHNYTTESFTIAQDGALTGLDTAISGYSDIRLKKNIEDYQYDWEKFKQFKTKIFDWINPREHGNKSQQIGFIAQDLEKTNSRWVREKTLNTKSPDCTLLDEDRISKTSPLGQTDAMYVSIIQQLITKVENIEKELKELKNGK